MTEPNEAPDAEQVLSKSLAASILGKLGGAARSKALTPERRTEIARMGGKARARKRRKDKELQKRLAREQKTA